MLRALALACLLLTALAPGAAAEGQEPAFCNELTPDCDDPNPGTCRGVGYDCLHDGAWCDYFVAGYCVHN